MTGVNRGISVFCILSFIRRLELFPFPNILLFQRETRPLPFSNLHNQFDVPNTKLFSIIPDIHTSQPQDIKILAKESLGEGSIESSDSREIETYSLMTNISHEPNCVHLSWMVVASKPHSMFGFGVASHSRS